MVVRPAGTAEVAAALELAGAAGCSVVVQGGNTGLVGGAVPREGAIVMSLGRLDALSTVDERAGQLSVGAGVTLARAQDAARSAGLDFAVDLAARDQATIGGMVASNAGGVHVLRHGDMRANLAGLEAVLAGGQVVRRMSGVTKDNTGYDLIGLLAGSEGTLGVVTEVLLRLIPLRPSRVTGLLGVEGDTPGAVTEAGLRILAVLRRRLASLEAAEMIYSDGLRLVCEQTGMSRPLRGTFGGCLMVECAGEDDPTPALADAIEHSAGVVGSAVATDEAGRRALWAYRERHTEAVSSLGVPHKLDVCIPLSRLALFAGAVGKVVDDVAAGATTILFGHLGDGNIHVNVVGPAPDDEAVDDAVLHLALDHGGSISAEHGIGLAKTRWLERARSPADVAAMRAIKTALDPSGLLNPGVIFGQ